MLTAAGSTIIRRYGLLNEGVNPRDRTYGIPHPGTFIVDRNGRVTARFFEQAYQEPLDERFEVYKKSFRLLNDLTIPATPEARKLLADHSDSPGGRSTGAGKKMMRMLAERDPGSALGLKISDQR